MTRKSTGISLPITMSAWTFVKYRDSQIEGGDQVLGYLIKIDIKWSNTGI